MRKLYFRKSDVTKILKKFGASSNYKFDGKDFTFEGIYKNKTIQGSVNMIGKSVLMYEVKFMEVI